MKEWRSVVVEDTRKRMKEELKTRTGREQEGDVKGKKIKLENYNSVSQNMRQIRLLRKSVYLGRNIFHF